MDIAILTFNVRYDIGQDGANGWALRLPLILETIASCDADVIAFQEVLPHQRRALAVALPTYRFVGRGRDKNGEGEQCTVAVRQGIEVLQESTFWLSPNPDVEGSLGWDAMLTRICTWARLKHQGQEFAVYNAHFDHHGTTAPHRSADLILSKTRDLRQPFCVVGDFNSVPSSETMTLLRTRLRDSLTECNPENEAGTYHEFGTLERPIRIDYLMMSPEWEILDCQILAQDNGPYPSDHFPVLGRYRL